jgi:hypothetical protein
LKAKLGTSARSVPLRKGDRVKIMRETTGARRAR